MWVLDYMDDLESDFSVFHRIEDIRSMNGPRFFRMAHRIFAYAGVMASRYAEQHQQSYAGSSGVNTPAIGGTNNGGAVQEVPLAQLQAEGIVERRLVKA